MQDLFGLPVDWDSLPPAEAAGQLYILADREPPRSAERARLYALAGQFASKAREQARRLALAAERKREAKADDIARIKRATWVVPA